MQSNEASRAFRLMKESAPILFETRTLLEGAFELAIATHVSVWDCIYIAPAAEHNFPIIAAFFKAGKAWHPSSVLLDLT